MPSWNEIAYLALLWAALSLGCSVVTQLIKVPIKVFWKQKIHKQLRGDQLSLYNWSIRTITIIAGFLTALLPKVWPDWVSGVWCAILGATAGCFSMVIYAGLKVTIPKLFAVLPEALRKRLGGN